MKPLLHAYLEHRADLAADQAGALADMLTKDPEARAWLRGQLEVDELLSRLLDAGRAAFPDRIRLQADDGAGERFAQRVQRLAAERRLRQSRQRARRAAWLGVAATLAVAGMLAWMIFASRREMVIAEVVAGEVEVDERSVQRIPAGTDFRVSARGPAELRFGDGSRASLAPDSRAAIRPSADAGGGSIMRLAAGGGEFQPTSGPVQLTIETEVGTVIGSGGRLAAELNAAALPADEGGFRRKSGVLTVAVRSGSARVEVNGRAHTVASDEVHVFSHAGGKVAERASVHGTLRGLRALAEGVELSIETRDGQRRIAADPGVPVRIDGQPARIEDLRCGDAIDLHVPKAGGAALAVHVRRGAVPPSHPPARPPHDPHASAPVR